MGIFRPAERPLAVRMRPTSFEEFLGQRHLFTPGGVIDSLLRSQVPVSLILYGPPGTGKTTLALLIAKELRMYFVYVNAATSNVKELRHILSSARERFSAGQRTLLFVDEIQRFNATQQEVLLPFVEEGSVALVGASVENPTFVLIPALVSRSIVVELKRLSEEEIVEGLRRALADKQRGIRDEVRVEDSALGKIARFSDGDMRKAYNLLELVCAGRKVVRPEDVEKVVGRKVVYYDRKADQHYDTISSFIKAMRRGDEESATYWLVKMLGAGEDPRFIARRMIIFAAEDVGMADPQGLVVAVSAYQALQVVGLPEAELNLMHACVYLSRAPKSREVKEIIDQRKEEIEKDITRTPDKFFTG